MSSSSAVGGGSSAIPTVILSMLSNTINKELCGAVLTTIHEELMSKDARHGKIMISSLPSKPGISDTALVDALVETEFASRPLIACTRRLGRVVSSCV